jgi:NADH:ubiquinone oxidoreductase subunit 6 (subunit J)
MSSNMIRAGAVAAMALMFIGAVMMVNWPDGGIDTEVNDTDVPDDALTNSWLAKGLFGEDDNTGFALVMFLIGLLLLVALLGGVFLAKEEKE